MSSTTLRRTFVQSFNKKRNFHASTSCRDLVGPPDPVSHIRPIIYEHPQPQPQSQPQPSHPYSLFEFKTDKTSEYDLQYKLLRQQLDTLHQNYWFDSNSRFYAAKAVVQRSLPLTTPTRYKEEAMSIFFGQWVMQERDRADAYTEEWRKQNFQLIKLGTRVELHKLKMRLMNYFRNTS